MYRLLTGEEIPLEFHRVRVVQRTRLIPAGDRLSAMRRAGHNTFHLPSRDVFLDMLTDSGVNAVSDRQLAAMHGADEAYAGSESFVRLQGTAEEIFAMPFLLPVCQGRAAEDIICRALVRPGSVVPMNYHFTTIQPAIAACGGEIAQIPVDEALDTGNPHPFKGNFHIPRLARTLGRERERIPFIRVEACANLLGGQPFSLQNLRQVRLLADGHGIPVLLDASLLAENLHLIREREPECRGMDIRALVREIASLCSVIYFSGRKLGCARGGAILCSDADLFERMKDLAAPYGGFFTYGGMAPRDMESLAVGLEEAMDPTAIRHSPDCVAYMVRALAENGIPVVIPPGALGCYLDAGKILAHVPRERCPAAALASALYLTSGIRAMERGILSSARGKDGQPIPPPLELVRLALPRRTFTLSQVRYAVDRIVRLHGMRDLIGGLRFAGERERLRLFWGKMLAEDGWDGNLLSALEAEG
ncbi:MAG: tryptophanase [Puniceicoccales bacterium]|nr:tryptophanase [Puniceicoccales bacterium]